MLDNIGQEVNIGDYVVLRNNTDSSASQTLIVKKVINIGKKNIIVEFDIYDMRKENAAYYIMKNLTDVKKVSRNIFVKTTKEAFDSYEKIRIQKKKEIEDYLNVKYSVS